MASRLLHRLRHALASDGPGEAAAAGPEAEQFPESSELEDDDAEGLSSRLSGTLSFTSAEDNPDDEDEDDEAGLDSPPSGDGTSGEDAGECGRTDRNPRGLVRPPRWTPSESILGAMSYLPETVDTISSSRHRLAV